MSRIIATSRRPVWIALGIALLLQSGLISVQAGGRIDTSFVRVWLMDSLAPMEKAVDWTLTGIASIWHSYFALVGVQHENEQLRALAEELRMQIERENEDIKESARLRALLALRETGIGRTVVARVIGRDPVRANETVTIDKGSSQGVKPDSAVITPDGIAGRVIHSSNFFSIVQLVTDSQSAVGVMLQSTRRQGVLRGGGAGSLELEYIDDDNDLKEGDAFITSGLDRIYPKGLPVGVITKVGARRGLFRTVQVRPRADLGRLEEVLCILDHPEKADADEPSFVGPPAP